MAQILAPPPPPSDREAASPPLSTPPPARPRRGQIILALLAVYVVWGSTYLGIRVAIESIPPLLMAGIRFLSAGVLMLGFARLWLRAPWPTRTQWRDAGIIGACLLFGGNGGVTLGERDVPSGLAALLVTTVPMFLLLFGWWAGMSPRPGWIVLGALALGWVGVGLLVGPASIPLAGAPARTNAHFYGSSALILGAAAIWAVGSLYAKRADKPASAVVSVGAQMLLGGALLTVTGLAHGEWAQLHVAAITARSAWAFVYLILVGAIVGYSAYLWLLGACSPALVGTYAFVNPAVAVGLGWAILGEPVNPGMLLGMSAILAAVALIVLFPAKTR